MEGSSPVGRFMRAGRTTACTMAVASPRRATRRTWQVAMRTPETEPGCAQTRRLDVALVQAGYKPRFHPRGKHVRSLRAASGGCVFARAVHVCGRLHGRNGARE